MALNTAQIDQFKTEGYTTLPDLFDAREIAALQAEIERFKRQGLGRNVATDGDGETHSTTKVNFQVIPLLDKSDLIRALPYEPKVLDAVSQLIGQPFVLHLDQMFLKPGGQGMGTSWHQDNAYFRVPDPMKGTAMWVAIHDATLANGTLHVIPGSYTEKYEHGRDPNSDHHIYCTPPAEREARAVALEMTAGSAVFFCYGTAHCTKANTTDRERAGIAFHFLHTDCVEAANLVGEHSKPLLTGPEASGGEKEHGVKVAGTWRDEVERTLTSTAV